MVQVFIKTLLFVFLLSTFVECNPNELSQVCGQRKEWSSLTSSERTAFITAVKNLALRSGSDSAWDRITRVHSSVASQVHGTNLFFHFHRGYLAFLERMLGVPIPYWDSSKNATAPHLASIWGSGPDQIGGDGRSSDFCVSTGPFGDGQFDLYRTSTSPPSCLRRDWSGVSAAGTISAFYDTPTVNSFLSSSSSIGSLRRNIENTCHSRVHVGIGGDRGDMTSMLSPYDPVFWLHHSWIDKLWCDWQIRTGRYNDWEGKRIPSQLPGLNNLWNSFSATSSVPFSSRAVTPSTVFRMGPGLPICTTYAASKKRQDTHGAAGGVPDDVPAVDVVPDDVPAVDVVPDDVPAVDVVPDDVPAADDKDIFLHSTPDDISAVVDTLPERLTLPDPLPLSYIEGSFLNPQEVRGVEHKVFNYIKRVNKQWDKKHSSF